MLKKRALGLSARAFACTSIAIAFGIVIGGCQRSAPDAAFNDVNNARTGSANTAKTLESEAPMMSLPDEENSDSKFNTETYDHIAENEFLDVLKNPQSTFSIDVDTASYSNVRRMLNNGTLPPAGAVRIEELVNYFSYSYPQPEGVHPFSVVLDVAGCPWNNEHQLVRVALKGKEIEQGERPSSNLVFLLDVSGSMNYSDKLPLVKSAMRLLVDKLDERDQIAIVVYAGASGLALPSTPVNRKAEILTAIDSLGAGGSTNGGEGINLAYKVAADNFIPGGTNRVILCTDGDFNVGTTNQSDLVSFIETKAKSNIFLSVFGFGSGNLKDSTMEKLADKGNGNYAYIDSMLEARKALVRQMGATLVTIAKDVKIQIDFNPNRVSSYRLIGYENRLLANEDFDDDTKDAGEIGAGHTVTAIYEIVPANSESESQQTAQTAFVETKTREDAGTDSIMKVALRYKEPEADASQKFEVRLSHPLSSELVSMNDDFRFASAVAAFGMLLRESRHAGQANWDWIVETAEQSLGDDQDGFRTEFVSLVKKARLASE